VVNETTDTNPKGVEFLSLLMFNSVRVGSSMGHRHGFPNGGSPVAIHIDPLRDAVITS